MAKRRLSDAEILSQIPAARARERRERKQGLRASAARYDRATGRVVLEAENTVVTERDVTAHAELDLVRRASMQLGVETLEGATLYASTEPCAMCSAAIYWSGIGRVVYALGGKALMAIVNDVSGSGTLALSCREVLARGGRSVEVSGPHLEEQARPVHEGFWD